MPEIPISIFSDSLISLMFYIFLVNTLQSHGNAQNKVTLIHIMSEQSTHH